MGGLYKDGEQREQWRYWLALRLVRGVGNVTYRELLEHFATPQAVFTASLAALTAAGAHPEVARAIAAFDQWPAVETELHKIARTGVRLVTRTDEEYPVNLTHLHDPPPFLYVRGAFVPEDRVAIAIVGSRVASSYGRGVARDLARGLAEKGVTVVSGLARGIDGDAHRAAQAAARRRAARNRVIEDSARPVENIEDILNENAPTLPPPRPALPAAPAVTLAPHEAMLVDLCDVEPLHVDTLIGRSGLSAARVL